jgi:hypothetical protein
MRSIFLGMLLAVPAMCAGEDAFLFPRNFVRGYVDFELNPPHHERDLGRCLVGAGFLGNQASPCAAFTRYMLGGYVEFQLIGRKAGPLPLDRLFVFLEPKGFLGRNTPQVRYTASMEPILLERLIGVGVVLPRNFEFRIWQHQNHWLGRYRQSLGLPDMGPNGPGGMYAGVALRWYHGWGRQSSPGYVEDRRTRFVRGFVEFEVDPPHNEHDLGRCRAEAGAYGGAEAPCSGFGRYAMGGYFEIQPFGRKIGRVPLQKLLFIMEPKVFFGRNVPQFHYSASMEPILFERSIGVAIALTNRFELRATQHSNAWLGRYGGGLGPGDLGSQGPYGDYASVGLRWYFGGWGRPPSQ